MKTESRYGSAAGMALDRLFQPPEAGGPEVSQECVEGLKPPRVDDIQAPAALPSNVDQTSLSEDLQVLGNGLLCDVEMLADLARRSRLVSDQSQHRLSPGLDQRTQHRLASHAMSMPPRDDPIKS